MSTSTSQPPKAKPPQHSQPKTILLTGASGFVGSHLARKLSARGDVVRGLTRSSRSSESGDPVSQWFQWQGEEHPVPAEALSGADAVVHLAGENVAGRWTDSKKKRIRSSRVGGTARLVEAIESLAETERPSALISASAIGFYGDRGDTPLAEDAGSALDDFLAEVCRAWEAEANNATAMGLRVATPRIGLVMHPDGGALEAMLTPFKMGFGGKLGSGKQWQSWIHLEDLLSSLTFAIDNDELSGPFNATAPEPVRQKEFAKTLGKVLGRPTFIPAPAFALKAILGEFATELLSSKRVIPEVLKDAGFRFAFPHLDQAFRDLLC